MPESVDQMITKKNTIQEKANELKKTRDDLHKQSKKLADERDDLNSKIRELRNKISTHRKTRDELNERVKHFKEERNSMIKHHADLKKSIKSMEKNKSIDSGVNINQMKQQLRKLENEQMTQILSSHKEKKMIETMKDINQKIKEQENLLKKDPKLKEAIEEEKQLRQKIEKQHESMQKLAKRAQEEHEQMIELRRSLDNFAKKANGLQEKIVLCKIEADKVHKDFIDNVNTIHELEHQISGLEKKKHKEKKQEDASQTQQEANDIYDRFKRGEKLSTEDLMILQKAGLI